jgi:hypothetical protein
VRGTGMLPIIRVRHIKWRCLRARIQRALAVGAGLPNCGNDLLRDSRSVSLVRLRDRDVLCESRRAREGQGGRAVQRTFPVFASSLATCKPLVARQIKECANARRRAPRACRIALRIGAYDATSTEVQIHSIIHRNTR